MFKLSSDVIRNFIVPALFSVFLVSCMTPAPEPELPVSLPEHISDAPGVELRAHWWEAFEDSQLDGLIEQALAGNFDLLTAWSRLDKARAAAVSVGAARFPEVTAAAGAERSVTRTDRGSILQGTDAGRNYAREESLGLVAGYELDLWGKIRSAHSAALLDVDAVEQDLRSAATTLSARIANVWYRIAEQHRQLALIEEQVTTNEHYLELISLKFKRGRASATDVLQQRQLVEQTRGERLTVESVLAAYEHELAAFVGKTPGTLEYSVPGALPLLPPSPRAGLSTEWLAGRPDLRAAELRVRAADRRVAAAMAEQWPRLDLSLRASSSTEELRDIFDNWLAKIAADLTAPIFDAGRRRAGVRRARSAAREALDSYASTLLGAFREVRDALVREEKQGQYIGNLDSQLVLSSDAVDQLRDNYLRTGEDFSRYLTALLAHQRLQRSRIAAIRKQIEYRISLYRALSGGWVLTAPKAVESAPGT